MRQMANHVRQQVVHAQHRVVVRIVQLRFAAFAHVGIGAIGFKYLKLRRNAVGAGFEHGRCQAVHGMDGERVARLRVFEAEQILNLRQLRIGVAPIAVEREAVAARAFANDEHQQQIVVVALILIFLR